MFTAAGLIHNSVVWLFQVDSTPTPQHLMPLRPTYLHLLILLRWANSPHMTQTSPPQQQVSLSSPFHTVTALSPHWRFTNSPLLFVHSEPSSSDVKQHQCVIHTASWRCGSKSGICVFFFNFSVRFPRCLTDNLNMYSYCYNV